MGIQDIKFVGSPCGQHGPYTFYKAFKYCKKGKWKILSLGEFFYVKILEDAPICVGELQLLWTDKHNPEYHLCMVRLYFLPENTPEGRQDYHGQDEILAESDKIPLRIDDLLTWVIEDEHVDWDYGSAAMSPLCSAGGATCAGNQPPVGASEELLEKFHPNNRGLPMADVRRERQALGPSASTLCPVVILSYPQYCRFKGVRRRLEGCSDAWLSCLLVAAIGGVMGATARTRVMFCRDTFESIDVQDHELRQDYLAPNLKGRRRKKKLVFKRDSMTNNDSDSSESSETYASERKAAARKMEGGDFQRIKHEAEVEDFQKVKVKCEAGEGENGADDKNNVIVKTEVPVAVNGRRRSSTKVEDERVFLERLHAYMHERGTPIDKVPTLGFKEMDLHHFYTYCQQLGGYEAVTSKRLWKQIYDALGGNPNNTSAATCTRRHYEKMLLAYERHEAAVKKRAAAAALNKPLAPAPHGGVKKEVTTPSAATAAQRDRRLQEEEAKWEQSKRLPPGSKLHKASMLEKERQWEERRRASLMGNATGASRGDKAGAAAVSPRAAASAHPYRPVALHTPPSAAPGGGGVSLAATAPPSAGGVRRGISIMSPSRGSSPGAAAPQGARKPPGQIATVRPSTPGPSGVIRQPPTPLRPLTSNSQPIRGQQPPLAHSKRKPAAPPRPGNPRVPPPAHLPAAPQVPRAHLPPPTTHIQDRPSVIRHTRPHKLILNPPPGPRPQGLLTPPQVFPHPGLPHNPRKRGFPAVSSNLVVQKASASPPPPARHTITTATGGGDPRRSTIRQFILGQQQQQQHQPLSHPAHIQHPPPGPRPVEEPFDLSVKRPRLSHHAVNAPATPRTPSNHTVAPGDQPIDLAVPRANRNHANQQTPHSSVNNNSSIHGSSGGNSHHHSGGNHPVNNHHGNHYKPPPGLPGNSRSSPGVIRGQQPSPAHRGSTPISGQDRGPTPGSKGESPRSQHPAVSSPSSASPAPQPPPGLALLPPHPFLQGLMLPPPGLFPPPTTTSTGAAGGGGVPSLLPGLPAGALPPGLAAGLAGLAIPGLNIPGLDSLPATSLPGLPASLPGLPPGLSAHMLFPAPIQAIPACTAATSSSSGATVTSAQHTPLSPFVIPVTHLYPQLFTQPPPQPPAPSSNAN